MDCLIDSHVDFSRVDDKTLRNILDASTDFDKRREIRSVLRQRKKHSSNTISIPYSSLQFLSNGSLNSCNSLNRVESLNSVRGLGAFPGSLSNGSRYGSGSQLSNGSRYSSSSQLSNGSKSGDDCKTIEQDISSLNSQNKTTSDKCSRSSNACLDPEESINKASRNNNSCMYVDKMFSKQSEMKRGDISNHVLNGQISCYNSSPVGNNSVIRTESLNGFKKPSYHLPLISNGLKTTTTGNSVLHNSTESTPEADCTLSEKSKDERIDIPDQSANMSNGNKKEIQKSYFRLSLTKADHDETKNISKPDKEAGILSKNQSRNIGPNSYYSINRVGSFRCLQKPNDVIPVSKSRSNLNISESSEVTRSSSKTDDIEDTKLRSRQVIRRLINEKLECNQPVQSKEKICEPSNANNAVQENVKPTLTANQKLVEQENVKPTLTASQKLVEPENVKPTLITSQNLVEQENVKPTLTTSQKLVEQENVKPMLTVNQTPVIRKILSKTESLPVTIGSRPIDEDLVFKGSKNSDAHQEYNPKNCENVSASSCQDGSFPVFNANGKDPCAAIHRRELLSTIQSVDEGCCLEMDSDDDKRSTQKESYSSNKLNAMADSIESWFKNNTSQKDKEKFQEMNSGTVEIADSSETVIPSQDHVTKESKDYEEKQEDKQIDRAEEVYVEKRNLKIKPNSIRFQKQRRATLGGGNEYSSRPIYRYDDDKLKNNHEIKESKDYEEKQEDKQIDRAEEVYVEKRNLKIKPNSIRFQKQRRATLGGGNEYSSRPIYRYDDDKLKNNHEISSPTTTKPNVLPEKSEPEKPKILAAVAPGDLDGPPLFTKRLNNLVISEGQDVSLECCVFAQHRPMVMWFKNSQVLRPNSNCQQNYDGAVAQLKLQRVTSADEGSYECVARNSHGKGVSVCRLTVKNFRTSRDDDHIESLINTTTHSPISNHSGDMQAAEAMDVDEIDDEGMLINILTKTESAELRKNVRERLRYIRNKNLSDIEANRKELAVMQRKADVELRGKTANGSRREDDRSLQDVSYSHPDSAEGSLNIEVRSPEEVKEDVVARTTRTEKLPDGGKMTTTTTVTTHKTREGNHLVTKQSKQISRVGGIGSTNYDIQKSSADEIAQRLAGIFENKAANGTSGVVVVNTEYWNSQDGITNRAQKAQPWTGSTARSLADAVNRRHTTLASDGSRFSPEKESHPRPHVKVHRSATTIKQKLLEWCRAMIRDYKYVNITNFSSSWNDGMAFCALIHKFCPDAFDYDQLNPRNHRHNFQLAFDTAEKRAGITQLLDVEDMVRMKNPDWKCVLLYVESIYRHFVIPKPLQQQNPPATSATNEQNVNGASE